MNKKVTNLLLIVFVFNLRQAKGAYVPLKGQSTLHVTQSLLEQSEENLKKMQENVSDKSSKYLQKIQNQQVSCFQQIQKDLIEQQEGLVEGKKAIIKEGAVIYMLERVLFANGNLTISEEESLFEWLQPNKMGYMFYSQMHEANINMHHGNVLMQNQNTLAEKSRIIFEKKLDSSSPLRLYLLYYFREQLDLAMSAHLNVQGGLDYLTARFQEDLSDEEIKVFSDAVEKTKLNCELFADREERLNRAVNFIDQLNQKDLCRLYLETSIDISEYYHHNITVRDHRNGNKEFIRKNGQGDVDEITLLDENGRFLFKYILDDQSKEKSPMGEQKEKKS